MTSRFSLILIAMAAAALPLAAQQDTHPVSIGTGAAREVWLQMSTYVTQSAEDMPAAKYDFKPTAAVRSFGQLIGHVAGSQYMFCAAALGDSARAENDVEKSTTTKEGLVAAMKASNAYCERAYAQGDGEAQRKVALFGQQVTRMYALVLNAAHDGEHYGNIVTYLRLNDMVPPSSKGP